MSYFFDIEKIFKKVESLEGVKMVEIFHAIRIGSSQMWLKKEIDRRLADYNLHNQKLQIHGLTV